MRTYVIMRPSAAKAARQEPVILHDGFSWPAFLFGPLWLLWHRLLPEAAVLAGLWLLTLLLPPAIGAVAGLLLSLLLGLEGNMLRRLALKRRGWREEQLVLAPDADTALQQALHGG